MLTLQKTGAFTIASVATAEKPVEDLINKEWLLTNNRGGYASSTIIGCNTTKYHGLLIGSLNPPVNRIMALANCLEMVILDGAEVLNLSTFEFNEKFSPKGFGYIKRFRRATGVHFDYELAQLKLTKSVYLLQNTDTVAIVYDFTHLKQAVEFVIRPVVGLRGFHTLQKSYAPLCTRRTEDGLLVRHDIADSCELFLSCPAANFEKDEQWWFNFVYRKDKERGEDFTEDLWTPGFFKCRPKTSSRIVLWASLAGKWQQDAAVTADVEKVCEDLRRHQEDVKHKVPFTLRDKTSEPLCLAADQFIMTRQVSSKTETQSPETSVPPTRTTIMAGFPWFADWGRDAFICLPGLLLSTGRFEEARSVLTTFAEAADEGMIPNRFDDYSDTAYFNSVDASLWFINAAFQYLNATRDSETFVNQLLPMVLWVINRYYNGTRFDIRADSDELITAGNEQTQLTWMDAKYNQVAFTPRYGKAVEVNALWYNSLCSLAEFYAGSDVEAAEHYHRLADRVEDSFRRLFWNEAAGYVNDCVLPDGSVDASLRPNQIFAVSLSFSPLASYQQRAVVDVVQRHLLTPFGLRTLDTGDSRYKGKYTGDQQQRDQAYHQGTVWPYLIGPFVEAYLKVNDFSRKSKKQAAGFIEPLMRHLTEDGCLGQLCEIFDGDAPHTPRGCIAQAWSIAELIRAYQLINS